METVSTAWHVLGAGLVFCVGVLISLKLGPAFGTSYKRSLVLYVWHTLLCLVYVLYVLRSGGDALMYYESSLSGDIEFSLGTAAVQVTTSFLTDALGLSLLGAFLGYNIFGYVGLLAFDATLQSETANNGRQVRRLATFIVFLPSVSFWSSAIGKDAISFMAASLALWAAQHMDRRVFMMGIAVALMLLVRPHIAAMMVMAIAFSMAFQPKIPTMQRLLVGAVAVAMAAVMVPMGMSVAGLGEASAVADLSEFVDVRQGHNLDGGGAVDIASMGLPMKLFTYLFRPLPFEASTISSFAASIDNVVLLGLVMVGLWQMLKRRRQSGSANRVFLWVYACSVWLILALTTANLGISVRQKWMFVPMLVFLFISVIGRPRTFQHHTVCDARTDSPQAQIVKVDDKRTVGS